MGMIVTSREKIFFGKESAIINLIPNSCHLSLGEVGWGRKRRMPFNLKKTQKEYYSFSLLLISSQREERASGHSFDDNQFYLNLD
jgi:hypothetical protein